MLAAVPAVVAILASPAWGLVADRLGDMRVPYLVAAIWAALAAVGLAMAPGMPWLAVAVLMLSVGAAGLTPLIDARTIQRLWPQRERFGQARVAGSFAFMAGTIGTGILIAASDLRMMFVVYAVAMTGAGIAAAALLGRPRGARKVGSVGPRAAMGLLRLPGLGALLRRVVRDVDVSGGVHDAVLAAHRGAGRRHPSRGHRLGDVGAVRGADDDPVRTVRAADRGWSG